MNTQQLAQLRQDLRRYDTFWIRYTGEKGRKRAEIRFWIPSPFGLCEPPRVHRRGSSLGLLVTTETLTQPNGPPDDPTFPERAGVPGMDSPADYGLRAVKTWIPLDLLLHLRMKRWSSTQQVLWQRDAQCKFLRTETE